MAFRTGKFKPKNTHKYLGDIDNIEYRSSWELNVFEMLDGNINVLAWASEEIKIPYLKPLSNGDYRLATYYPDVYVEYVNKNGEIIKELMEIKPKKQTKPSRSKNPKVKLTEEYNRAVNMAKWDAAKKWCDSNGITFRIYTEESVYGGKTATKL